MIKLKIYNPFPSNQKVWKHRETRIISKGKEVVQGHSGFGNSVYGPLEDGRLGEAHPVLTDLRSSSNQGNNKLGLNNKLGYCSLR